MAKIRLDKLLVELGLAPSREKAAALILAGSVLVDDTPITKAGAPVLTTAAVRLRDLPSRFVSRGGDKIDPVFERFGIVVEGRVAIDVGASTGGFTDCLLQRGAIKVFAVDVGHNQLAHKIRQDSRVEVFEGLHARDLSSINFSPRPSLAVIDVSFIGLRKILGAVIPVLARPFAVIALVKPQFELEPKFVGKGGVVREEEHQRLAVSLVEKFIIEDLGLEVRGQMPSPLKGEKSGNQEFFLVFTAVD